MRTLFGSRRLIMPPASTKARAAGTSAEVSMASGAGRRACLSAAHGRIGDAAGAIDRALPIMNTESCVSCPCP